MPDLQYLTPFGFADVDEIRAYMKRENVASTEKELPRIIAAANEALAWMESDEGAGRALAVRTYRNAASIASCGLSSGDKTVTGTGFTAGVKQFDDVLHAVATTTLEPGTRVASVASDSALELTKPAIGTDAAATLTFGSEPLKADGWGGYEFELPEYPAIELYSVKWIDDTTGDLTSLDLTAARPMDPDRRRWRLPNDANPKGEQNLEIECAVGYRQPTTSLRGDWVDWNALKRIQLRAALVIFQDWNRNAGRIVSENLAQQGINIGSWSMPSDIRSSIMAYRRRW